MVSEQVNGFVNALEEKLMALVRYVDDFDQLEHVGPGRFIEHPRFTIEGRSRTRPEPLTFASKPS